jgi:hypothetical protein
VVVSLQPLTASWDVEPEPLMLPPRAVLNAIWKDLAMAFSTVFLGGCFMLWTKGERWKSASYTWDRCFVIQFSRLKLSAYPSTRHHQNFSLSQERHDASGQSSCNIHREELKDTAGIRPDRYLQQTASRSIKRRITFCIKLAWIPDHKCGGAQRDN